MEFPLFYIMFKFIEFLIIVFLSRAAIILLDTIRYTQLYYFYYF